MRRTILSVAVALLVLGITFARGDEPAAAMPPAAFWLAPKINLTPAPIDVTLEAPPDSRVAFGLIQIRVDPSTFVVTNPLALPFVQAEDAGYAIVPGGLKVGAAIYGDRTYIIEKMPPELANLPLLRTKAAHKPVVDGRFAIVVNSPKPCYVMVAIDERAILLYNEVGAPGWLQEFAPTEHKIQTNDPLMANAGAQYQIFARKAQPGKIALGPPCMDVSRNSMYFAFFSEAK